MLKHNIVVLRVKDYKNRKYTAKFDLTGLVEIYNKYRDDFEAYEILEKIKMMKILFFSKSDIFKGYIDRYFIENKTYPKSVKEYAYWLDSSFFNEEIFKNFTYTITLESDKPTKNSEDTITFHLKTENNAKNILHIIKQYMKDIDNWNLSADGKTIIYTWKTNF
ncbi:hypothetical protein X275_03890 [Marinitoga sp. 1197]|uniref:hypothetical protein n=1 Tax=Marinitoga sp. 1197 TaxID=1428449 RepID=UPI000640FB76|nr:hypothetical protein [Marinitoga sp. 1197]KLO23091.1 hypothetical protein X275_03890 [Marinitoga sp. 1197]